MSWFARSLVNTLRGEEEDDDDRRVPSETVAGRGWNEEDQGNVQGEENGSPSRGVKEDLSELTKTLTRRLWGVASFLAPPPSSTEEEDAEEGSSSPDPSGRGGLDVAEGESDDAATAADSPRLAGIRSDFAEISGKVRSGISMLSQAKAVAEISKLASSLLPFGSDEDWDEDEEEEVEKIVADAVGVTEEVVVFARSIAMHPETWLGFPLLNSDDFEISDAQQKHALAVEHFAPELADLRIELCPSRMSEANFWKIYFVLLHSRLDKQDAEILSTPQILEARTVLLQDSQIPKGQGSVSTERVGIHMKEDETAVSSERNLAPPSGLLDKSAQSAAASDTLPEADIETGKHAVEIIELNFVDKSVTEEAVKHDKTKDLPHDVYQVPTSQHEGDDDDGDDWLDDATGEDDCTRTAFMRLGQEEDVSFSDLEDDDVESGIRVSSSKTEDSRDWVQLNKDGKGSTEGSNSTSPPSKEASDWLNLEDIDVE